MEENDPEISNSKIRLWLCGSISTSPIKEKTHLVQNICDIRDSLPHTFLTLTDKESPIEKIRDFRKMIKIRSLIEQKKITQEEGDKLFQTMAQGRHLRSDVTPTQMKVITEQREVIQNQKMEKERLEMLDLLQKDKQKLSESIKIESPVEPSIEPPAVEQTEPLTEPIRLVK